MTVRLRAACCGCLALALTACGGSSSSPTSPTTTPQVATTPPPAASATGVTIAADPFMYLATQQTANATTRFSDGRSAAATGQWTSDSPAVVSVSSDGRLSAIGPGEAIVRFTSADGLRASTSVSVRADLRGSWLGAFRVLSCEEQDLLAELKVCQTYRVGNLYRIAATLDQVRGQLTGHADLIDDHRSDDIRYELPADGALRLDITAADVPFRFRMIWDASTRVSGQIQGDLKLIIRVDGFIGEVTLKTVFVDFRRIDGGTRTPVP
jgi:hypothetical protein